MTNDFPHPPSHPQLHHPYPDMVTMVTNIYDYHFRTVVKLWSKSSYFQSRKRLYNHKSCPSVSQSVSHKAKPFNSLKSPSFIINPSPFIILHSSFIILHHSSFILHSSFFIHPSLISRLLSFSACLDVQDPSLLCSESPVKSSSVSA